MTDPPPPAPEGFARDDRFVRALLRRFVADPNAIDDLAQETWLAVLKQAGSGYLGRAWLSTVARNFAFQTLRANQRRLLRESKVARGLAVEPDGDVRFDADLRARVLAAVAALDEHYRDIVRQRFFEDLTPAEIAERTGIPIETIRTRLRRALAQVHRALMRRGL